MSATRIATRYAKSILDLSIEKGQMEQVHTDIQYLASAVKNRDLYLLLKNPVVKSDKKMAILQQIFQGKISPLTLAYLNLLVQKGREMYIPEIAAELEAQYSAIKHITKVRLTTATPMDEKALADLKHKLITSGAMSENVDVETKVDASLIGGFVLEFNNKRYDASVAHKLDTLKAEFKKNFYVKEF